MKKKLCLVTILIAFVMLLFTSSVKALTEEEIANITSQGFAPKARIYVISNNGGKVTVDDSITDYKLQYSWLKITEEIYDAYVTFQEDKTEENRDALYEAIPSFPTSWEDADSEDKVYLPENYHEGDKYLLYLKLHDNTANKDYYSLYVFNMPQSNEEEKASETINEAQQEDNKKDNTTNPKTSDVNILLVGLGSIIVLGTIKLGVKKLKD